MYSHLKKEEFINYIKIIAERANLRDLKNRIIEIGY